MSVTRFEIDHLRNLVVLLDHNPLTKHHAASLQQWIEDKTSRPTIDPRSPSSLVPSSEHAEFQELRELSRPVYEAFAKEHGIGPPSRGSEEEFGKLLDDLIVATQWTANWQGDDETCPFVDHEAAIGASLDAKAAIESYVSRLQSQHDWEKDCVNKRVGAEIDGLQEEIVRLRAALASLKEQQRGISESTLTEEIRSKEARLSCAVEAGAYGPIINAWMKELDQLRAKLRLLSTSDK